MRAVEEDEEENFPLKYLQQSSGGGMASSHSSSSANQLDDSAQEARWEKRLSELGRVESLLQKRKAELQQMDAVLMERRHQLDDVVHKRKITEGRLRRAEEDAGIIEQRAAETSVELIRAGNQLINLEIKGKALSERQEQMNKGIESKSRELKDVGKSCEVVRQNVDKLNKEMANNMEELENKESKLKDVESRIQLSLRVEELKQFVAKTETEEKNQAAKYVRALKDGEEALEEKTVQLARTRNELQTQMIQFHELSSKINKLRTELKEIQANMKKGKAETEKLSERREEERRIQQLNVKEAEQKLVEINDARNESMDALKSHREEFGLLRGKINESMNKIKEYEELKKQKEAEYNKVASIMNEGKVKLQNELTQLKSEKQVAEESVSQINGALKQVTTKLETAREESLALTDTKDLVTKELNDLQLTLTEKRSELIKTNQELEDVTRELQTAKENHAEARSRQEEMIENRDEEYNKVENHGKDGLPQKSSTPKNNGRENGPLVTRLQQTVKQLTAENEEQHGALEDARVEVKELKEFMKSERENFQDYLTQMASECEVYRTHLDRLHIEYDAEKQRYAREKDLLLNKAEQHRLKARKLSEELSNLKQNHVQTKQELNQLRDTLAKDVKELKKHIEGITTQMKSELSRSLKQVESSKDETSDEFERLRGKKDEMEIQLVTLQQSINSVKTMALMAEKEKTEIFKREKEEALIKEKEVKLQRHQTYLRAQIRQQMSTRAVVLDEERKKAEVSLEGLKNKLKNLEEVITRKDSSVEDFRLKLLRNKVEAEKAADSNKQIDELRRRLRQLEDEKDLITSQRNHLAALNEGATSLEGHTTFDYHGELNARKVKMAPARSRRSLDSLVDGNFYTKPVKLEAERPCRDVVNLNTSLPLQAHDSAPLDLLELNTEPYSSASRDLKEPKWIPKREMDHHIKEISTTRSKRNESRKKPSLELKPGSNSLNDPVGRQNSVNSPSPMLRKELSSDYGDKVLHIPTIPEGFQTEKPLTTVIGLTTDRHGLARGDNEQQWSVDKNAVRPTRGISSSTFADDKKSEFLSSVLRLKNEKVKELELSLQKLFLT